MRKRVQPVWHLQLDKVLLIFSLAVCCLTKLVAAQSGNPSCPTGFPADASCNVCHSDSMCASTTGNAQAVCYNALAYSSTSQAKAYQCNTTDPSVTQLVPSVTMYCKTGFPSSVGSCTLSLLALGNNVVCTTAGCSLRANSSNIVCEKPTCKCVPGPCNNPTMASIVEGPFGELTITCDAEGLCTIKADGLPADNVQMLCDVGECLIPGTDSQGDTAVNHTANAATLMDFKASFENGDEALPDWNETTFTPCSWTGVWCNTEGRVTRITLRGSGLRGTIPPQGWLLPNTLTVLSLTSQQLYGTLPPILLPPTLQQLLLSQNQLTGAIPGAEWELPATLEWLWLDYNRFSGTIDPGWRLPPNLTNLVLGQNQLTGSLPVGLPLPDSLQRLSFWVNRFNGSIPGDWSLPSSLQYLGLDNNSLTGSLPPNLKLPPGVQQVNLTGNYLSGPLPGWSLPANAKVLVLPQKGGPGLCGTAPNPNYYSAGTTEGDTMVKDDTLASCQAEEPAAGVGGSSISGAAIGGIVAGAVVLAAVAALAAWVAVARRRRRAKMQQKPYADDGPQDWTAKSAGTQSAATPSHKLVQQLSRGSETRPWQPWSTTRPSLTEDNLEKGDDLEGEPAGLDMVGSHTATSSRGLGGSSLGASLTLDTPITPEAGSSNPWQSADSGASGLRKGSSNNYGMDLRLWQIDFRDLELQREIGEGSFGKVYLGLWRDTRVAVKVLRNSGLENMPLEEAREQALSLSNPILANLQKESAVMALLRHPNVLSFLGVVPMPPCVVTEYCPRGSLADILRAAKRSPALAAKLDWSRRLSMMLDTAKGLVYLHGHNPPIIHRDLKSPNLLLDASWHVKVSDFNLSRVLEESTIHSSVTVNNPRWLAPEVMDGNSATLQSDVFSFGVVMWELLTWEMPFTSENHWQVVKFVTSGGRLPIPSPESLPGPPCSSFDTLQQYIALLNKCWAHDPAERPCFVEISESLRGLLGRVPRSRSGMAQQEESHAGAERI